MKKTTKLIILLVIVSSFLMPVSVFAIGKWIQGTVTTKPWSGEYTHIRINDIKYTIMPETRAVFTYQSDSAEYREPMEISAIEAGDTLLVMVEGNRIYQIEKIR
jgi:hypothetical protein